MPSLKPAKAAAATLTRKLAEPLPEAGVTLTHGWFERTDQLTAGPPPAST